LAPWCVVSTTKSERERGRERRREKGIPFSLLDTSKRWRN